jgi:hypothetical protein
MNIILSRWEKKDLEDFGFQEYAKSLTNNIELLIVFNFYKCILYFLEIIKRSHSSSDFTSGNNITA